MLALPPATAIARSEKRAEGEINTLPSPARQLSASQSRPAPQGERAGMADAAWWRIGPPCLSCPVLLTVRFFYHSLLPLTTLHVLHTLFTAAA